MIRIRKRTKVSILKQIEAVKIGIAKKRDEIRELIDELEQLDGDTSEASDELERAADALSRLV